MDSYITIKGNVVRDPELRFTQGGTAVTTISVAQNRRFQQNGEWVDGPTTFYDCILWDKLAEHAGASITKGMRVIVTGYMETREYETKEGDKRKVWELKADDIGISMKFATATVERVQRDTTTASRPSPSQPPLPTEYVDGDEPF